MEETVSAAKGNPSISVDGVTFEWDREQGIVLCWGVPMVCMWIETVMAGFMKGLQRMVGTERFNLAMLTAGWEAADAEWEQIILTQPTIEQGFELIGEAMSTVGLGRMRLLSLDREKKEIRLRVTKSWEGLYQKALGVTWGTSSLAGKLSRFGTRLFETNCRAEQVAFEARGDGHDEFVVRPSATTLDEEHERLLEAGKATSADLAAALEKLQREIAERKSTEEKLQREIQERKATEARLQRELRERAAMEGELSAKLELIRRQEEAIRAMATPILQIWDGVLALPVIGLVDAVRASHMMESLLREVSEKHARFAILDLTGVDMIDTGAANHILMLVRAVGLLGTRCIVSGISPQMARTVVDLGLSLNELATFNTLESALRYAIQQSTREAAVAPRSQGASGPTR